MTGEDIRNDYVLRTMEAIGREWSGEHSAYTIRQMAEEIVRLRAILAMLKQPSDDLIDAASRAFTTAMTGDGDWYAGDQWGSIAKAIAAALTTAEQEVAP